MIQTYGQYLVADTEAELLLTTPQPGQIGFPLDSKIRLLFDGSSWRPNSAVQVIRGTGIVNGKNAPANTKILTTPPTSFRFVPLGAHIETIGVTGTVGVPPTVSCGVNSPNYNDLFQGSVLNSLMTGAGLTQPNALAIAGAVTPLVGSTDVFARVTVAATLFTTYTFRIDLFGYYEQ